MKSLNNFIVYLEKKFEDEIETEGGLKLYIDTKFEPFKNRVNEGEVVAVPAKHETGVEKGDTLYFHHLVVMADAQPLPVDDNHFVVHYHPDHAVSSQAFAYKSKRTGKISALSSWSILSHVEQKPEASSSGIQIVKLKEPQVKTAKVAFENKKLKDLGVKKGDVVGVRKDSDYSFKIDGDTFYRTRLDDIYYVEA
jgi:co-chaperonin GroES (HSP10)